MTNEALRAFHGKAEIKDFYVSRVRAHRMADNLIQGTGWDPDARKGCGIGCTLESYSHARYPIELGIPESLAHLEDQIFEGLPVEYAKKWPEKFLDVITPGADLSRVTPQILLWMMVDPAHGVRRHARAKWKSVVDTSADVLRTWIATGATDSAAAERAVAEARAAEVALRSRMWSVTDDAVVEAAKEVAEAVWRDSMWSPKAAAVAAIVERAVAEEAWWDSMRDAKAVVWWDSMWSLKTPATAKARHGFYIALSTELLRLLKAA